MKEIVISAEDKQSAIEKALEILQVDESDITVIEEQFGELISDRMNVAEKHFRITVTPLRIAEDAAEKLCELVKRIGLKPEVEPSVKNNIIFLKINTDDNALLIGRRGKNLDAIQHIINRMLYRNRSGAHAPLILLDTENYCQSRIEHLETVAMKSAAKAAESRKDVELRPMSSEERKIIHTILRSFEGVKTYSVGQDEDRHIVVSPDDKL